MRRRSEDLHGRQEGCVSICQAKHEITLSEGAAVVVRGPTHDETWGRSFSRLPACISVADLRRRTNRTASSPYRSTRTVMHALTSLSSACLLYTCLFANRWVFSVQQTVDTAGRVLPPFPERSEVFHKDSVAMSHLSLYSADPITRWSHTRPGFRAPHDASFAEPVPAGAGPEA